MMRALITGGTGFAGRHLVSFLQGKGAHVAVLASAGCGEGIPNAECFEIDIRDIEQVRFALHNFQPDHIYHLAAISSVDLSWKSPRLTYEVNVFGTFNVVEAAGSVNFPPRILNVSTAQVYARSASALNEHSPLAPDNPYAASKAMAEMLSVQYRGGTNAGLITVRSFNHAGPGQSPAFVISSIARQFAEIEAGRRDPRLVLGNIHVKRDFTDVRDVVRAYSLLVENADGNEVYNVCSGRACSIQDVVNQFESISGIKVQIETNPTKFRSGEVDTVYGDSEKIRTATGWQPQIPLQTTVLDTLNYWRCALRDQTYVLKDEDCLSPTPPYSK